MGSDQNLVVTKFPFKSFFLCDKYIFSALGDQRLSFLKSCQLNLPFSTVCLPQVKRSISLSHRVLSIFYSNIRALAMLSRCSLELSMGVKETWEKILQYFKILYKFKSIIKQLKGVNGKSFYLLLDSIALRSFPLSPL